MSDKPQTLADAIDVCLEWLQRLDGGMRTLARQPGPAGPPGPRGRDAADLELFKDYIDQAVAKMFCTASVSSPDGGRTLRWLLGGQTIELKTAIVLDAGVWKEGAAYVKGDGVTSGGSFWIAQADTSAKPGKSVDEWRLAVKRGNDGRDFKGEIRNAEPVRFR